MKLTNRQARRFLLLKHGLLGKHRFIGKRGVLEFVRQAGCIQFDPVDACGKNAELTLQSRVKGFSKPMLHELLYKDRALVDYPDKNLSIIPTEDWPYFSRFRQTARDNGRRFEGLAALEAEALRYISENGPVNSGTLPIPGDIVWHSSIHWSGNWSGSTNAARAVLEQLYSTGDLVIYDKDGARKTYDLAQRHLPASILCAPDPLPDEEDHRRWRVLRRIGAVGLLWDRPSDAWLNIWGLTSENRHEAFDRLQQEGKIIPVEVEGIKAPLFCLAQDTPLLNAAMSDTRFRARCELIAPLDCMLWDRKLIRALFGFDYTWEIYTPASKRKYGYYVLPMIYGERFAGRVEAVANYKAGELTVKHVWLEDGVRRTKALDEAMKNCFERFAAFNGCSRVIYEHA